MSDDQHPFGDEHVRVYRETNGEKGYFWKRGTTILLLTTKGRRSGRERITPLIHRPDGPDRWVVVASKGGWDDHPGWFHNLEEDPDAEIQVKEARIPVRARVAEGEERERLWGLMAEVWPAYDEYQAKTGRQIPVVVLERR